METIRTISELIYAPSLTYTSRRYACQIGLQIVRHDKGYSEYRSHAMYYTYIRYSTEPVAAQGLSWVCLFHNIYS